MAYAIVIAVLASYLLGNLNGAVCMSTLLSHEDVREHGSGNAGLTNFARNYGGWNSLLVVLIDGGKAVIATVLSGLLLKPYGLEAEGMMLGAVAVSLGHDFPALLGFRVEDGSFAHGGGTSDAMASEQGLQALEALRRFYAGEKRFFDMTDAGAPVQWTADSAAAEETAGVPAAVYMAAGAAVVVAAGIVIVRKGRGSHE